MSRGKVSHRARFRLGPRRDPTEGVPTGSAFTSREICRMAPRW